MLIQDRVKLIIKANNLTASEFADQIGIKRSNLSHVLNGRNKPGLDFLCKVIDTFPNVNASWLITGQQREGTMREESKVEVKKSPKLNTAKDSEPNHESTIDRIVVFYNNGRFKEYEPSEG
jgi:transcriptional regulator with XRE-family HTH domain